MTVIVGATNGKTWCIGADRGAYSTAGTFRRSENPKVWRHGDALIGASGYGPVDWILRETKSDDPYEIARFLFERKIGGEWRLLIVRKEGVYELDSDCQVYQWAELGSIGIGEGFCLGAMAAIRRQRESGPIELVTTTLRLAASYISDCRWGTSVLFLPEGEEGGEHR